MNVDVYMDDTVVKSKTAEQHAYNFRKLFQILNKFQMKLNPKKCIFGVTSSKLLGFIITQRGIEVNPEKN